MPTTLHRQGVNEPVWTLDLTKSAVLGVTALCSAYVREAVRTQLISHSFFVPHPSVRRIAKPCNKAANATRPVHLSHASGFDERHCISVSAVALNKSRDVRDCETERAAMLKVPKRIAQSGVEVLQRQMFEDVGTIDCRARAHRNRKTLNDVAVPDIRREAMPVPAVEGTKHRKTFKAQCGARIEI
jgi:hypothetical protein